MSELQQSKRPGSYRAEAEELGLKFHTLLSVPEGVAKIITQRLPSDAGELAKDFRWRRPSIREIATQSGWPKSYSMALVKECLDYEQKLQQGKAPPLTASLSQYVLKWIDAIAEHLAKQNVTGAKKLAGARVIVCPTCKEWQFLGHINHAPTCHAFRQEQVRRHQASQPSKDELTRQRIKAAHESQQRARHLALQPSIPSPKHSKTRGPANCPPIIPGGGIETNRRNH